MCISSISIQYVKSGRGRKKPSQLMMSGVRAESFSNFTSQLELVPVGQDKPVDAALGCISRTPPWRSLEGVYLEAQGGIHTPFKYGSVIRNGSRAMGLYFPSPQGIETCSGQGDSRPPVAIFLVVDRGISAPTAEEPTTRLDDNSNASSRASRRGNSRDPNAVVPRMMEAMMKKQIMYSSPIAQNHELRRGL